MAREARLAMALALAAGSPSASSAASGPGSAPEVAMTDEALTAAEIIDLQYERFRRLTVPVTIDGKGPFRFMIDTGAQATVLSRALADELGLFERRNALLVGMASSMPVETVSLDGLSVGRRTISIPDAPLVDGRHIGDADGILGIDTLQDQRVLLDFHESRITLMDIDPPASSRFEIVVRARERLGQLIVTRAVIDGVRTTVLIDTGAAGSVGNPVLEQRLRRRPSSGMATITDVNGAVLAGDTRIAGRLQLGNAVMRNLVIAFADSPTFHRLGLADEPALILGMSELRLFRRVAIDFRERRILLDVPHDALDDMRGPGRLGG